MAETRTIRTVLELNAQRFTAGAAQASAAAKSLSAELGKVGDAQGAGRANYDRVANSLLGIGTAAAAGLGLAAKASMDWESAWAGVLKTVDGTPEQLGRVEEGLRGLTKELPASHTEIAAVAEAAGQLGVETDSVVDFTRVMIDLGETTNLSAEEAATSLARFSNIMGTSQGDVDRLGAALVGLGNNYATTESEILQLSMRLAGTSNQLGLTEGDVMGLAAAMSSVGISAEAGGTAMSMGMRKINDAVGEGGESLAGFAEVAGMSADEFSRLWAEDAAAGLEAFVSGLGRIGDEGGNVSAVLSDLGIKGIRESDTFLRLAGSADILGEALAMGNAEFEKNIALVEEAAQRYKTTESQLQIAKNAIVDAGISLGAQVLPVLADVAGGVADLAGWFGALPEPVQRSVAGLGALVGATGLVAGGLMRLVPSAMQTVNAFRDLRTTSPQVASALGGVGRFAARAGVAFVALQAAGAIADQFRELETSAEGISSGLLNAAQQGDITKATLDELFSATGTGNAEVRDLAQALDILDAGPAAQTFDFLASGVGVFDTQSEVARRRINELDQALAALYSSGNAELVAQVLAESGVAVEELIEKFPTLKKELTDTATAMELEADAATLAKIATGELVPVVDEATGAVTGYNVAQDDMEGATDEATGAVEEQVSVLGELQDALNETANLLLGVRGSELDFLDSVDAATDALEENGRVLDENGNLLNEMDEDARASRRALDDIASSTHSWADSVEEAGGSAEELDGIMSRGRDRFIEMAEGMGMSEDAARELADQLGLTPEFVSTEFQIESQQAMDDWAAIWDELGSHPPLVIDPEVDPDGKVPEFTGLVSDIPPEKDVTLNAETEEAEGKARSLDEIADEATKDRTTLLDLEDEPARGKVQTFGEILDENTGNRDVNVGADIEPAMGEVARLESLVMASGGSITINGETYDAETSLTEIMSLINSSDGTVTINGEDYPAEEALNAVLRAIDSGDGTVTIGGDNTPAKNSTNDAVSYADRGYGTMMIGGNISDATWATDRAVGYANRSRGSISVSAATGAANAAINWAARRRYATIQVNYSGIRNNLMAGRADGGWINPGLSEGGWVPGPYPGPGIDNTWMPVQTSGGMGIQPLAGTEFVVNGDSAKQWGPALEAINAGMKPQPAAAPAPAAPSVLTLDGAALGAISDAVRTGASQARISVGSRDAAQLHQSGRSSSRAFGGAR